MYYNAAAYEAAIRGDLASLRRNAETYERIAGESRDDQAYVRACSNAGAWFSSTGFVEAARERFDRALGEIRQRRIGGLMVVDASL